LSAEVRVQIRSTHLLSVCESFATLPSKTKNAVFSSRLRCLNLYL